MGVRVNVKERVRVKVIVTAKSSARDRFETKEQVVFKVRVSPSECVGNGQSPGFSWLLRW